MEDSRESELQAILRDDGWRAIKSIADSLGIVKPDDAKWIDVIPAIIEAETSLEADELELEPDLPDLEPKDSEKSESISQPIIKGTYATEHYKRIGIPYCSVCGEAYHHTADGLPVCPESLKQCPRLNNELV